MISWFQRMKIKRTHAVRPTISPFPISQMNALIKVSVFVILRYSISYCLSVLINLFMGLVQEISLQNLRNHVWHVNWFFFGF